MKRSATLGAEGQDGMAVNNVANLLQLLSAGAGGRVEHEASSGRVFECKTCNRKFSSFQALGGHRASHKKPRLETHGEKAPPRPKTHECPICGLEFAVGQALGGHMRRHKGVAADGSFVDGGPVLKKTTLGAGVAIHGGGGGGERRLLEFDLNVPPAENDSESIRWLTLRLGLPVAVDS